MAGGENRFLRFVGRILSLMAAACHLYNIGIADVSCAFASLSLELIAFTIVGSSDGNHNGKGGGGLKSCFFQITLMLSVVLSVMELAVCVYYAVAPEQKTVLAILFTCAPFAVLATLLDLLIAVPDHAGEIGHDHVNSIARTIGSFFELAGETLPPAAPPTEEDRAPTARPSGVHAGAGPGSEPQEARSTAPDPPTPSQGTFKMEVDTESSSEWRRRYGNGMSR